MKPRTHAALPEPQPGSNAAQVMIKASRIFILDHGAHRQLLNATISDRAVDLRTRAIYILQRVTAMRISEALSLDVRQVYDGHQFLPYVALRAEQTKGKREGRNLSLLDRYRQAHTALKNYIRLRESLEGPLDPDGPLFTSSKIPGKRLDRFAADDALRRWASAAGLPVGKHGGITTHTPRHTKLSEAVNKSDLALAIAIAGHADPRTLTERYLHVSLDRLHDHNNSVAL